MRTIGSLSFVIAVRIALLVSTGKRPRKPTAVARIAGFSALSFARRMSALTARGSFFFARVNAVARSRGRDDRFGYHASTLSSAHSGVLSAWHSLHALGMP